MSQLLIITQKILTNILAALYKPFGFHACFLFLLCFFTFMPITRLKPEKVGKQQSIHGLLHSKYPLFLESYSCLFLSPR